MARFTLSRRSVLRGMAGVTVPLPALEIMLGPKPAKAADGLPRRFVVCYGGISVGAYGAPHEYVVPKMTGPKYDLTRGLAPIGKLGMQDQVGIVSGLKIPGQTDGATIPPAGRLPSFHGYTMFPLVCGTKATQGDEPGGPSSDQIVAEQFAREGDVSVHSSIQFRVQ